MGSSAAAVPAALAAAACYAVASALQHHEARRSTSDGTTVAVSGLFRLLRRPLWLLGGVADVAGLFLHVLALGLGPVSLVQPLQVTGLLYALPLSGLLTGNRTTRRDLVAAAAVVAGLGLFLAFSRAPGGHAVLGYVAVVTLTAVTLALLGLALLVSRGLAPHVKSVLLATVAGGGFAVTSVLLEDLGELRRLHGWSGVATGRGLTALAATVAIGAVAVGVSQAAFQVGTLGQALPALTVSDPVVAVVLAAVLLREGLTVSPVALVVDVLAVALVAAGAVHLARADEAGLAPPVEAPAPPVRAPVGLRERLAGAGVGGAYGLLPAVVGTAAMSKVDTDGTLVERLLMAGTTVAVCAAVGAVQRRPSAPTA
ncbi:hypothetical protein acdb102_18770 [Acidothermaceae bacterium B102]|nr:hypothetical protein acdb102_18770 [Acidothermaceae bacterium B102]